MPLEAARRVLQSAGTALVAHLFCTAGDWLVSMKQPEFDIGPVQAAVQAGALLLAVIGNNVDAVDALEEGFRLLSTFESVEVKGSAAQVMK